MSDCSLWWHYLLGMPLYTLTNRYSHPDRIALENEPHFQAGATYLRQQLGERFCPLSDWEIARRASWTRLWREADTYAALGLGRIDPCDIRIRGHEYLNAALSSGKTVYMLTAHAGSFYFACQSLAAYGFNVFPIARSVDTSTATPKPVQWYLNLNYRLSGQKFNQGHYLYTDFGGRFDRRSIEAARSKRSLLLNAIDMPPTLYLGKRATVKFLGQSSDLPINFIQWAHRRNGILMSYLTGYDADFTNPARRPQRTLEIFPPFTESTPEAILQTYANRLEAHITSTPWNWMGLPIAAQYHQLVSSPE